jgi:hypothetical protein
MKPEAVELAVILGNNKDKFQALEFMNDDQIKRVLEDLFSRANPLVFYDVECEAKELGLPEFKTSRSKKVELIKAEGIFLVNKLIELKKMPTTYGLTVLKQLETIKDDWEPWWRKVAGKWVVKNLLKIKGAEIYLSKQIIDQFAKQNNFPDIFKVHKNLFTKYQGEFLAKLKQTKNLAQLQMALENLLGLIDQETKKQFSPHLSKFFHERIKTLKTKELLIFHKGARFSSRYLEDGANEVHDLLFELITKELPLREHVLKPSQSKLIRKMSIHAGKKLGLKQAQLLENALKSKKK